MTTDEPPANVTRCGYAAKYGSKRMTSSPGLTVAHRASMIAPLVPAVTENVAILSRQAPLNIGEQPRSAIPECLA